MATGNRKGRRAAAASTQKGPTKTTATDFEPSTEIDEDGIRYLLQHPDRSGPKGKTLFELADERQRELDNGNPAKSNLAQGNTPSGERSFGDEDPIGPFGEAILYSVSLATVHVMLDVLVYSQYREEVMWSEIFQRAGTALPIFFALVYIMHVDFSRRFPVLRNLFFFVVSVISGCWMIYSGNKNGYFFVMKTAPPIGSFWIWSVAELHLVYAVASAATVFAYLWWNEFAVF